MWFMRGKAMIKSSQVKEMPQLTSLALYLRSNDIGDAGAQSLSALKEMPPG